MAHMSVFPGNHEIVEIEEFNPELQYKSNSFPKPKMRHEDNDWRSLASSSGNTSSLEEDLNQLFETLSRRASSHRSSHQNQVSTSKRNSSKKTIKAGGSQSPGISEISERVNMKQALRGLCLSQASEMAAMKRSMKSPRSSEAGRITTMYHNVVVEDGMSAPFQDTGGLLEISLVPEQTYDSFQKNPEKLLSPDLWPSNRNSLPKQAHGPTTMQNDRGFESMFCANKKSNPENPEYGTSSLFVNADANILDNGHNILTQNAGIRNKASTGKMPLSSSPSPKNSTQPPSCSDYPRNEMWDHNRRGMNPPSVVSLCQAQLDESLHNDYHETPSTSSSSCDKISLDIFREEQNEMISTSPAVANQDEENSNTSCKVISRIASEVSAKELGNVAQDSMQTIPSTSSPKDRKVCRSTGNAQYSVKPPVKAKFFVKRRSKKKMASDNSSKSSRNNVNDDLCTSPNPIMCPNCQCDVTDVWQEANKGSSLSHQDSPISSQVSLLSRQESAPLYQESPFDSLSGEASPGNIISDSGTPESSYDGLSKSKSVLAESSSNSKSRNKAEFTQSAKSSPDESSSSTSVSEESNLGRPSICDRPHMSKDVRWDAIRHVKFQYGNLGLRNFNLLKKLGCGDIGTVYLAELIGTDYLFAIKVMDNEFLARRKKIAWAQTEKEILRMLDRPFLPTLYSQFISDNLSCLVMEYCSGGDLHVVRQRQPGRCFTEQAARFYVAEVLLALEYLHMLGVIYRDLKPENILVREDGHIMLSDFDLSLRCAVSPTLLLSSSAPEASKRVSRDFSCVQPLCIEPSCQVTCFTGSSRSRKLKPDIAAEVRALMQLVAEPTEARSNSFVGTHEYLSPEIIKGEGHGSAVDWWTFGVFLYELLYGRTPFKGPGNEETMANVIFQNLKFPDSPLVSLQARDLIAALLVKEPENRLGTERGAAEIKQHPFFDGLNWALIRCAVPPELPEPRSYPISKVVSSHEKNKKVAGVDSGSVLAEHLEFELF